MTEIRLDPRGAQSYKSDSTASCVGRLHWARNGSERSAYVVCCQR